MSSLWQGAGVSIPGSGAGNFQGDLQIPLCGEVAQKFHLLETVVTEEVQEISGGFGSELLLLNLEARKSSLTPQPSIASLSLAASLLRGFEKGVPLDHYLTWAPFDRQVLEP